MRIKKKNLKYDFSWIENEVKKFQPEFRKKENIRRCIEMIPWKLTHWFDLDKAFVKTHLGELVEDDYFKLKDEYIENLIKKYADQ